MKLAQRISLGLFLFGFLMRLAHYKGFSLLLIVPSFVLVITSFIQYLQAVKEKYPQREQRLFELTLALWLNYLLFRIMYWPYAAYLWYPGFAISLYLIVRFTLDAKAITIKTTTLLFLLGAGYLMGYHVHAYSIYKVTNMSTLFNSEKIGSYEYDRYSYFLFVVGKTEEGIVAGEKAAELSINEHGINSQKTIELQDKLEQRKKKNYVP